MFFNNLIGIVGGILMYLMYPTGVYELFFMGRLLVGLYCGISTCLCPMYISEIAPTNIRGALGTINQLAVTIGLLLSQILGFGEILGSDKLWPYLLGTQLTTYTKLN